MSQDPAPQAPLLPTIIGADESLRLCALGQFLVKPEYDLRKLNLMLRGIAQKYTGEANKDAIAVQMVAAELAEYIGGYVLAVADALNKVPPAEPAAPAVEPASAHPPVVH